MNISTSISETSKAGGRQDSYLPLLIALTATLILTPFAKPLPVLASIIGSAAQLAGLYSVRHDRTFLATVTGGLLLCIPMRLAAQWMGDQYSLLILLSHICSGGYFAILAIVVLFRVIAHQRITSETVIGAVCGYLLIGYVFAFAYLVVVFFDPNAILVNGNPIGVEKVTEIGEHMAELFYFSFISLSTVGYGDIVPVCPFARILAIVEILSGQLYLVAFVARLVGAISVPPSNTSSL